ncbi:MAG: hypothetical protein ABJM99_07640 [Parasphingorhabdus sp.]
MRDGVMLSRIKSRMTVEVECVVTVTVTRKCYCKLDQIATRKPAEMRVLDGIFPVLEIMLLPLSSFRTRFGIAYGSTPSMEILNQVQDDGFGDLVYLVNCHRNSP